MRPRHKAAETRMYNRETYAEVPCFNEAAA